MYLKEAPLHFGWLLLSEGEVQKYITIGHVTALRGLSGNVVYLNLINLAFHLLTCSTPHCPLLADCDTRKVIILIHYTCVVSK